MKRNLNRIIASTLIVLAFSSCSSNYNLTKNVQQENKITKEISNVKKADKLPKIVFKDYSTDIFIKDIRLETIDENKQKYLELKLDKLSPEVINNLKDKYKILVLEYQGRCINKPEINIEYEDKVKECSKKLEILKGGKIVNKSEFIVSEMFHYNSQNGRKKDKDIIWDKTQNAYLVSKEIENNDYQIRFKSKDNIYYFNIKND